MRKWYTPLLGLGLGLYTATSTPLLAQTTDSTLGLPVAYQDITLTDAQIAKLKEIQLAQRQASDSVMKAFMKAFAEHGSGQDSRKILAASQKKYADARRAVLTPEQQKVLDKNTQIQRLFNDYGAGDRMQIFMGVNLTEAQLAAIEEVLQEEQEKLIAFRKTSGLNAADSVPPSEEKKAKARNFRWELQAKNSDALYAVLTPEQQKLAAPRLAKVKAMFEQRAQAEPVVRPPTP